MDFELHRPIDLGHLRDLVRIHATHCGLPGERADGLALAVNEAVTNAVDHGGQAGLVTARGHEDGVIVEVLDAGGRLTAGHPLDASAAASSPTNCSRCGARMTTWCWTCRS
ncbi:ATP-binding protein [Nonomuraea antri]|uniref:ATP-binding protein n=1 Tax=Nonomuraea antri TaxID=2730852 RepID=UPI001C2B993C|nr:ATP-binding protein [Nonomuraea antri]